MPTRVSRTRLLVKVAGSAAGRPFMVETRRPLFPGENLEDASQDKYRAAWAGASLGAFSYATDPAGSGRRVGRFTGAGKVYAGSRTRRARVVPGDELRTTLRGYRTDVGAPPPTLPSVVEATSTEWSTNNTTASVTLATLPAAGDVLVVTVQLYAGSSGHACAGAGAAWTKALDALPGAGNHQHVAWVGTGATSRTVTASWTTGRNGYMTVFVLRDLPAGWTVEHASSTGASGTSLAGPADTVGPGRVVLALMSTNQKTAANQTWPAATSSPAPASWTVRPLSSASSIVWGLSRNAYAIPSASALYRADATSTGSVAISLSQLVIGANPPAPPAGAGTPLTAGVEWQDETGAVFSEVLGSLSGSTPVDAWTELDLSWTVPETARAAVVYVSTPASASWFLDNGAGVTDLASRTSTDVGTITIRRGRTSPDQAPAPASCSTSFPVSGAVPVASGDLVTVEVPVERYLGTGVDPGVFTRFHGNATDPELNVRRNQLHTLELVAVSSLARLGRIDVGDTPWPQEPAETRAERILELAAAQDPLLSVAASAGVDPGPDVVARDVDSQPALGLLGELVESTGGQVIETRDGTIYFRSRAWSYGDGFMPTIQLGAGHYAEPLKLSQAPAVNSATVAYGTANPQASVTVEDAPAIAQAGRVAVRVSTQLATEADARAFALDLVGAGSRPAYQLDRLEIDLVDLWRREDAGQPVGALVLSLLSLEPGDVIEVLDLPPVVPELPGGAWFGVEGWTETITPTSWRLQLDLVDFARLASPAPWTDIPLDVAWADLPPDLSWASLGAWRPR
jgi:hypothetical protein